MRQYHQLQAFNRLSTDFGILTILTDDDNDLGSTGLCRQFIHQRLGAKISVGAKDFKGPLLVLQGTDDGVSLEFLTSQVVEKTCKKYPKKNIQYVKAQGVGHVLVMYATRQIWMEWPDSCFSGKGCKNDKGKCSTNTIGGTAPRPLDSYQGDLNYFLGYSLDPYQVA